MTYFRNKIYSKKVSVFSVPYATYLGLMLDCNMNLRINQGQFREVGIAWEVRLLCNGLGPTFTFIDLPPHTKWWTNYGSCGWEKNVLTKLYVYFNAPLIVENLLQRVKWSSFVSRQNYHTDGH